MLQTVLGALQELRSPFAMEEMDIHAWVARRLTEEELPFTHEARLAPGCRIDFLVEGVGVEIKKGKPAPKTLAVQLKRYAACPQIQSLVVVTERSVPLPRSLQGKPVRGLVLNQLWGVALP